MEGPKVGRQEGAAAARPSSLSAFLPSCLPAFLPCLSAFLLFCLPAFLGAAVQDPPAFRSGSAELVVLPVVVTDKQGRYITDLDRDRFTVFDNGRRVPIEIFSSEDTPLTVGLIIDTSGSMRGKIGEVVSAALAFARSSNPQDELFAIRFNDDVAGVLRDRQFLLASDLGALGAALASLRPDGRTALYDALVAGLDHLALGSRARKTLIVVSDGGDNQSAAKLEQVLARARASNASIYTIGLFTDEDMDKNPGVLKSIARVTGGERFLPKSAGELMQACVRIAREIRSGYTIGYVPPDRDGAYHRVRVEVQPPASQKVNVRTRPGYFAASQSRQPVSQ